MPRQAPSRRAGREEKKAVAPSAATRGVAAGLERAKREQAKADARAEAAKLSANEPFRFFIKDGNATEIIVVDEEPVFFRCEHQLQNPRSKRFDLHVPCIDDVANCPACEIDSKQPSYCMYLTVIDLTPYENSKGEQIEWSKKMLVVKLAQQKKFIRVLEKEGTLRGALFSIERSGKMSSNIGSEINFEEFVSEEELQSYETEYEDKDGNIVEVFGDEPFDYDEIYPDMTEDEIMQVCGIKAEPSNARSHRGGRASREAVDDAPPPRRGSRRAERQEPEEPAARSPRAAGRRSAPVEDAQEPAPRSRRRAAAEPEEETPAPRRASRRVVEEPEEPAPRRTAGRRAAADAEDPPQRSAARRTARQAEDNPLPDEAPATDRASRRANLRKAR